MASSRLKWDFQLDSQRRRRGYFYRARVQMTIASVASPFVLFVMDFYGDDTSHKNSSLSLNRQRADDVSGLNSIARANCVIIKIRFIADTSRETPPIQFQHLMASQMKIF